MDPVQVVGAWSPSLLPGGSLGEENGENKENQTWHPLWQGRGRDGGEEGMGSTL